MGALRFLWSFLSKQWGHLVAYAENYFFLFGFCKAFSNGLEFLGYPCQYWVEGGIFYMVSVNGLGMWHFFIIWQAILFLGLSSFSVGDGLLLQSTHDWCHATAWDTYQPGCVVMPLFKQHYRTHNFFLFVADSVSHANNYRFVLPTPNIQDLFVDLYQMHMKDKCVFKVNNTPITLIVNHMWPSFCWFSSVFFIYATYLFKIHTIGRWSYRAWDFNWPYLYAKDDTTDIDFDSLYLHAWNT